MGKFILGILAVILVQIAFGVYVSQDTSSDVSMSENRSLRLDPEVAYVEPQDSVTPELNTEDPVAADVRQRRAEPMRPIVDVRRARPAYRSSRRTIRLASNLERASMTREYFGGMVVERTFDVSNKRKQSVLNGVERQYFGKMIVERRSSISALRSKKNFGFAGNASPARADGRRS